MDSLQSTNTPTLLTTLVTVVNAHTTPLPDNKTLKSLLMVSPDSLLTINMLSRQLLLNLDLSLFPSMLQSSPSTNLVSSMVATTPRTLTLTTPLTSLVTDLMKNSVTTGLSETLGEPTGVKMVTSESAETTLLNAVLTLPLSMVVLVLDKLNLSRFAVNAVSSPTALIPSTFKLLVDFSSENIQYFVENTYVSTLLELKIL